MRPGAWVGLKFLSILGTIVIAREGLGVSILGIIFLMLMATLIVMTFDKVGE